LLNIPSKSCPIKSLPAIEKCLKPKANSKFEVASSSWAIELLSLSVERDCQMKIKLPNG